MSLLAIPFLMVGGFIIGDISEPSGAMSLGVGCLAFGGWINGFFMGRFSCQN